MTKYTKADIGTILVPIQIVDTYDYPEFDTIYYFAKSLGYDLEDSDLDTDRIDGSDNYELEVSWLKASLAQSWLNDNVFDNLDVDFTERGYEILGSYDDE